MIQHRGVGSCSRMLLGNHKMYCVVLSIILGDILVTGVFQAFETFAGQIPEKYDICYVPS